MDTNILAYLAGFFDGEGSISLNEIRAKVRLRVGQVVDEPLERYVSMFGGSINFVHMTTGGLPYFCYDTNDSKRCGIILSQLYPLLIVKQARAQVALERLELPVPLVQEEVLDSYFAGFFDAEGSVSMCFREGEGNKINPQIKVTQVDNQPLLLFQDRFGGYISKKKIHSSNVQQAYEWTLPMSKVIEFCDAMIPYCLVKRERLMLLKKFSSIRLSNNGKDSRIGEKQSLALKIVGLNN